MYHIQDIPIEVLHYGKEHTNFCNSATEEHHLGSENRQHWAQGTCTRECIEQIEFKQRRKEERNQSSAPPLDTYVRQQWA